MNKTTNFIIQRTALPMLADFFWQEGPHDLIIFCHGFKGFKDWGHFNLIAEALCKAGFQVLKFNFSLNGGTLDDPIDFPDLEAFGNNNYVQEIEDLQYIIDHLDQIPNLIENHSGKIHLLGHSRGGAAVVLQGERDERVNSIITLAGVSDHFARLPDANELKKWKADGVRYIVNGRTQQNMPMYYQFVEVMLANKDLLDVPAACKRLQKPHLIIQGTNDFAVSLQEAENIKKWHPSSELLIINGADHVFGGKHPFTQNQLPEDSQIAVLKIIDFLA